jgi:hypothetical protein
LTIGVYVSDPRTRITLRIEVYPYDPDGPPDNHQVTAELFFFGKIGSGDVVLTSTIEDVYETFDTKVADDCGCRNTTEGEVWALPPDQLDLSATSPRAKEPDGYITSFFLPDDSLQNPSSTTVVARLPAIATDETGLGAIYSAPLVWADDGFHSYPDAVPPRADEDVQDKPRQYKVPSGAKVKTLYWEPKTLVTTEKLSDVGDFIPLDTIQLNTPSNGNVQGPYFVWNGSFGLSPALLATNRSLDRSFELRRARNDFLSGVLLATSAAALIALIQEAPDQWPWRWWRRRRKPESAEKIDAGPPTPPPQSVKVVKVEGT